jgi:hypothetical protein
LVYSSARQADQPVARLSLGGVEPDRRRSPVVVLGCILFGAALAILGWL